jgi:flagellar biosynthesis protein FlhB
MFFTDETIFIHGGPEIRQTDRQDMATAADGRMASEVEKSLG